MKYRIKQSMKPDGNFEYTPQIQIEDSEKFRDYPITHVSLKDAQMYIRSIQYTPIYHEVE